MSRIPVAVIGAGHMGRHHVRHYAELPEAQLVAVIDADIDRARGLAEPLGARFARELTPELGPVVAVSVAAPTTQHLPIAARLIPRGIHLLIEKPLAPSAADAQAIADLAQRHNVIVAVGHTERFNPAVQAVERLGLTPRFIETHRISPFPFRCADVGVVFDMMIHDIDILLSMIRERPVRVDAVGVNVLSGHEDIANARVTFDGGAVANLTASRLALKTERKLRLFCEHAYVSVDYQKKVGIAIQADSNLDILKLARERNIEDLSQFTPADFGRMVKVEPLAIVEQDALQAELKAFLACVRTGQRPPVSVEDGVAAVGLAEQIVAAVRQHRWKGPAGQTQESIGAGTALTGAAL